MNRVGRIQFTQLGKFGLSLTAASSKCSSFMPRAAMRITRMRFSISSTGKSWLASERLQAREKWCYVRGEQPGLEFLQELLHRQQGVDLGGVEPQAVAKYGLRPAIISRVVSFLRATWRQATP